MSRVSLPGSALPVRVGSRDGTGSRCDDEATCATYDLVDLPRARVTARSSASGSGPLPGPFAMSEALIGPGALSDAALSGADSCAYPGSWVGATAISALSSVAGRAPSSAVSIEASSRAFVDP
jgi:hypothetical protein